MKFNHTMKQKVSLFLELPKMLQGLVQVSSARVLILHTLKRKKKLSPTKG